MKNGGGKKEVQIKMIARLGTKADEVANKSTVGAEADEAAQEGTKEAIRVLYRARDERLIVMSRLPLPSLGLLLPLFLLNKNKDKCP